MELSIIIVNYNTRDLTTQTIESVINTLKSNVDYEIILVDNNSTDGSIEFLESNFSQIKIIKNTCNLGFSKANNTAIKQSKGNYVLLLNSDTIVLENCLEECVTYMEKNKDIGVLGCKLLLENGELDHACKRGFPKPEASLFYLLKLNRIFPENKKFGQYTMGYLNEDEVNEVDSLTGAFMMLRREIISEVGLLDEDFFMYGEDLDWCFRIKEAGWKVVYYPKAKIIHYKGGSSKKKGFKTIYEFHRAMLLFYNKHYISRYNILVTSSVYLGICSKLVLSLFVNLFRRRGVLNDKGKSEVFE